MAFLSAASSSCLLILIEELNSEPIFCIGDLVLLYRRKQRENAKKQPRREQVELASDKHNSQVA
jgi:hypothetical protein